MSLMRFWLGRRCRCCLQVQASQEVKREMGSRLVPILQAGSLKMMETAKFEKHTTWVPQNATGIGERPQTDVWE